MVLEQIQQIIDDRLAELPSPETGIVINTTLENNMVADVEVAEGILEKIQCIGVPKINEECMIIYENNDYNSPVCIPVVNNDSDVAKAMGYGAFSIDDQGNLLVELPEGQPNPFSINSNGELLIDGELLSDGDQYSVINGHCYKNETDLGECVGGKGDKGDDGDLIPGETGKSITSITQTGDYTFTITYSDGETKEYNMETS